MEEHQIDEIHKIDIADQIFKIVSTEITTLDQIQIEVITQNILETVHIQTPGTDNIPITV